MGMNEEEVIDELNRVRDAANPLADVRAACGALVQEAYKRGSGDNLTVIMVRLEWEGEDARGPTASGGVAKRASGSTARDSAVAASKRRRLEAAASVNAQKVAAYERDIAVLAELDAVKGKETEAMTHAESAPAAEAGSTAAKSEADVKADEAELPVHDVQRVSKPVATNASLQARAEVVMGEPAE